MKSLILYVNNTVMSLWLYQARRLVLIQGIEPLVEDVTGSVLPLDLTLSSSWGTLLKWDLEFRVPE
jgi:hypothetical protein